MAKLTRYQLLYKEEIIPALFKEFEYESVMQVPKLEKIVLNIGVGEAREEAKALENAMEELMVIAGQKPIITKAKKSISNFKIREGWSIGTKVTLRGQRMYDFIDRLINTAIPRIRDFRGFSANQFDGRGNFSIGVREQVMFPEIEYDKIDKVRGMDITIVTSAKTDQEGAALIRMFGMPIV
ncbi:MAG: 50S ribosomal protein L5 [bacterium]